MKASLQSTLRLASAILITGWGIGVGKDGPEDELSPELESHAPELPDDENGIVLLERKLTPLDKAVAESLSDALEKMKAGNPVDDPSFFELLEKRHSTTREILKGPARFPRRTELSATALYSQVFQCADALAWRSSLAGDRVAATGYRQDMLRWSHLIRNGHPTLLEYLIGHTGWLKAFGGLLRDWENNPNQQAGLAEIEALHREFPCPSSELIHVFRREARFWQDSGGTREMLKAWPSGQSGLFGLREPFDKLTAGELLALPYDHAAEWKRYETRAIAVIEALRRSEPMEQWEKNSPQPSGNSIEVYRQRPNGLGDLLFEHGLSGTNGQVLSSMLFASPAMETCLAWLKAERDGKTFDGNSTGVKPDPMTGERLRIEPESRRIRSVGPDMKFENLDEGVTWEPGIFLSDDDRIIQVPAWRKTD